MGLIDDMVHKYPWGYPVDKDFYNNCLRRAALFERPLLIADGYLFFYDWGRKELSDPNSLTYALMNNKMLAIFTREDDGKIHEMPERQAPSVEHYKWLIRQPYWPELKSKVAGLWKLSAYKWILWPRIDNRSGFAKLVEELRGKSPEQLGLQRPEADSLHQTLDLFKKNRLRDPTIGARTLWEKAAKEITKDKPTALKPLMHIANEAYHYNLSLCAADNARMPIGVATRYSNIFAPKYMSQGPRPSPTFSSLELPDVLKQLPMEKFLRIVLKGKVQNAKNNYLNAYDDYISGAEIEAAENRLKSEMLVYKECIASAVAKVTENKAAKRVITTSGIGISATGAYLYQIGQRDAGTFLMILGSYIGRRGPHVLRSWRTGKIKKELETRFRVPSRVARLIHASRATATMWLSEDQGRSHTEGLPQFQ
jgi:hypothetical protein